MALAVDFLAIVDGWRSNSLDFMRTEVRVQASCNPLNESMLPGNGAKNLSSLSKVNSLPQVYGSRNSNKLEVRVSIP